VKARALGIHTLSITDHDTFAAYAQARNRAEELGLRLIQGTEISTRALGRSVHLLAYWPKGGPPSEFEQWLTEMLEIRRERNRRLAARLRELGLEITLEEAEAIGKTVTGRVHFARILIQKGYVTNINEAFERYIGEDAPGYVLMEDPKTALAVAEVRNKGGIPVLAHPIRLGMRDQEREEQFIRELTEAGLLGLEVMHSDHDESARSRYLTLSKRYGLRPTGGSDYHGEVKPQVSLGNGAGGNVQVPEEWAEALLALAD
jgi:predicted metal-dependent phosphoesterase TrpH